MSNKRDGKDYLLPNKGLLEQLARKVNDGKDHLLV